MRNWDWKLLRRVYFPALLVSSAVVLGLVFSFFNQELALKGSYTLVAVSISTTLFYYFENSRRIDPNDTFLDVSPKLLYLGIISIFSISAALEMRLVFVLVGIPIAYVLLAMQLRNGTSSKTILPQILTVFLAATLSKYLETGFYFGRGDNILHTRRITTVIETGSFSAIGKAYSSFPGLHVLSSSLSLVTGIDPYDSLILLGILSYTALILVCYSLYRVFLGRRTALLGAFALSGLAPVIYHATYFFPQSLAIVFVLLLLFLASKSKTTQSGATFYLLAMIVGLTLVVTHHLTIVLFAPIIVVLYLISLGLAPDDRRSRSSPRYGVFGIVALTALFHWTTNWKSGFYYGLIQAPINIVSQVLFESSASSVRRQFTFGNVVVNTTQIFDIEYLNVVVITIFLVLGIRLVLENPGSYKRAAAILGVGIVGSIFVLDLPIPIKSYNRIRLPFFFFATIVLGIGIEKIRTSYSRSTVITAVCVVLISSIGVTGHLVTADGIAALHDSPGPQTEFSQREFVQLEETASFVDQRDASVSTLWLTRITFEMFGVSTRDSISISEAGIKSNTSLAVYRENWGTHQIRFRTRTRYLGSVYLSPDRIDQLTSRNNQVYTSGQVGIVGTPDRELLHNSTK